MRLNTYMQQNISPEIITFFSAMIPLLDLKIAIPIGKELGLTSLSAFLFATAGAVIPPAIILVALKPLTKYIEAKSKRAHKIIEKILDKTRKEHSKNFERYGTLFLIILVAIPLPGSGAGTGALIAFLFGIDYWKALSSILIGTFIAGILIITGLGSITALFSYFG